MKRVPRLKSLMTPFPHSVEQDAPLAVARQFMMENHIRHLPVTNGKDLIGVITDRDIKLILGPDFDYPSERELTVKDVYLTSPYIVDISEPLDDVLLTMAERHIGSALVTKNERLVGIFTVTDACRCFGEYLREQFSTGDDEIA